METSKTQQSEPVRQAHIPHVSQAARDKYVLTVTRVGHQRVFRARDLTEEEYEAVCTASAKNEWFPLPQDGVQLHRRFMRAKLLPGWRWSDSRALRIHAVEVDKED